jgi:hypothetical protein
MNPDEYEHWISRLETQPGRAMKPSERVAYEATVEYYRQRRRERVRRMRRMRLLHLAYDTILAAAFVLNTAVLLFVLFLGLVVVAHFVAGLLR